MSQIHLAAAGSNTAPYDTWAKAATSIATAIGAMAAGDDLLIDSAYTESTAATSFAFPGTAANPCRILSGTHAGASGLDALAEGATITLTAGAAIYVNGSHLMYGVLWVSTTGSSILVNFGSADGNCQEMVNCTTRHTGGGTSSNIGFGNNAFSQGSKVTLREHKIRFGHANQTAVLRSRVEVRGGSVEAGGTAPSSVFTLDSQSRGACLDVAGFDFTNAGTSANLWGGGNGAPALMRDCTVASGWTGAVLATVGRRPGARAECWGLKVGSTKTRATIRDYFGDVVDSSTVYKTGGASDSAAHSYLMTSTANCSRAAPLDGPALITGPVASGSPVTVTLDVLHDSVTALTDREFWIEVMAADGQVVTSLSSELVAASSLAASAASWTNSMANPNVRKASVTITPTVQGPLIVTPKLSRASTSVHFDWPPLVA